LLWVDEIRPQNSQGRGIRLPKIQSSIIKFLLIRLLYKPNLKGVLYRNTCVLLEMNAEEEI